MKIDCNNNLESKSFKVINLFEIVSEVCQNIDDICLHKYQHLILKNVYIYKIYRSLLPVQLEDSDI